MTITNGSEPILEIKDLKTYYFLEKATIRAVDGVNGAEPQQQVEYMPHKKEH